MNSNTEHKVGPTGSYSESWQIMDKLPGWSKVAVGGSFSKVFDSFNTAREPEIIFRIDVEVRKHGLDVADTPKPQCARFGNVWEL